MEVLPSNNLKIASNCQSSIKWDNQSTIIWAMHSSKSHRKHCCRSKYYSDVILNPYPYPNAYSDPNLMPTLTVIPTPTICMKNLFSTSWGFSALTWTPILFKKPSLAPHPQYICTCIQDWGGVLSSSFLHRNWCFLFEFWSCTPNNASACYNMLHIVWGIPQVSNLRVVGYYHPVFMLSMYVSLRASIRARWQGRSSSYTLSCIQLNTLRRYDCDSLVTPFWNGKL